MAQDKKKSYQINEHLGFIFSFEDVERETETRKERVIPMLQKNIQKTSNG